MATGAHVATHCFGHLEGDYVGRVMCRDNTIARLRRDLAAANSKLDTRTHCMDDPGVCIVELERELAAARAVGELELNALDAAVGARQAELFLRTHHEDNSIQTEHWRRVDLVDRAEHVRTVAVDALLAARVAAGEAKEPT